YRIQGADAVSLTSHGARVSEQDLVNAATQFLLTRLPWNAEDITIEPKRPLKGPVQVSGNPKDVRLEATLHSPKLALGTIRVDVTVLSKGARQAEIPVSLDVHLCKTIAVASRKIDRGRVLTEEDVVFEKRAVDVLSGYLNESETPVGQRAKRPIAAL